MQSDIGTYVRIDFVSEIISSDKDSNTFYTALRPDPRRYEIVSGGGSQLYRDKYLNLCFELKDVVPQLEGVPIFSLSPTIKNSRDYAAERQDALTTELGGSGYVAPTSSAKPHSELEFEKVEKNITFISVDICNSTALRTQDAQGFDKSFDIFFREIGTVVGQFGGTVFKATGDGLIGFIDHPSINSQCDAAIDLSLTILAVLRDAINPALRAQNLPEFAIRIGADHGTARGTCLQVPVTGFRSSDVLSDALNRCVKIQKIAARNELYIGRALYERIHVQWLERCHLQPNDLGEKLGLPEYQIYRAC